MHFFNTINALNNAHRELMMLKTMKLTVMTFYVYIRKFLAHEEIFAYVLLKEKFCYHIKN